MLRLNQTRFMDGSCGGARPGTPSTLSSSTDRGLALLATLMPRVRRAGGAAGGTQWDAAYRVLQRFAHHRIPKILKKFEISLYESFTLHQ